MPNTSSTSTSTVFSRVGRNLHSFQVIEALLRSLLPAMRATGTIEEIHSAIQARTKKLRKASLGELAETFQDEVNGKHPVAEPTPHPDKVTFSFSWSVEQSPERAAAFRTRWRSLVKERNQLVHRQLLGVEFSQDQACADLAAKLDEQFTRLTEFASELQAIADARRLATEVHRAFIESGEFERLLKTEQGDA